MSRAGSNWRWLSGAMRSVVYAVQLGADVWVIHAFQKKSKRGIKTPKHEIDLIHARLRRVKEIVQ
jgi:phage-related protein